ncbi:MAG: ABC transporter substrate-binding protein [Chloroflexota bacterium]|nr:ABC transporter substrate-binding protein [Chloroflexota bacterium]
MGRVAVLKGLSLVLATAFIAACGGSPTGSVSSPATTATPAANAVAASAATGPITQVRIGLNRNLLFFPVWVAREWGYFKENGIDPKFTEIASGTELRTAILGGSVDFTVQVPEGSAVLYQKGAQLENVVATQGKLTWSLVLAGKYKGQSKLGDAAFLKGKTIGVSSRGSGSDLQLQALLRAGGLKPDTDVKIVAIGAYANGIPAMAQGRIDGMMSVEPGTSQAIAAGDFEYVFFGKPGVYPGSTEVPMGSLAAMKSYIEKQPDVVARVVRSVVEAESAMAKDPDRTLSYAAQLEKSTPDKLTKAVKGQLIPALTPVISEAGWNALMKTLVDAGSIKSAMPYDTAVATQFKSEWAAFKP